MNAEDFSKHTTEDDNSTSWDSLMGASFNGDATTEKSEQVAPKGYEKTMSLMRPLSEEAAKNFEITRESRNFRLGAVALALLNSSQAEKVSSAITTTLNDIGGMFAKNSKRGFRLFFQDRYKQNMQSLQESWEGDNSVNYAEVYSDIMGDFPELRNVKLDTHFDVKNPRAIYGKDISGKVIPVVEFGYESDHLSSGIRISKEDFFGRNKDVYVKGYVFDETQNMAVPKADAIKVATVDAVAKKLGIEPTKLLQNRKLLGTIMLAHEFGHQLDFRRNYFGAAIDNAGKEENFSAVLQSAYKKHHNDKLWDSGSAIYRMQESFRRSVMAAGPVSDERVMQLHKENEEAYREQMHESIADTFAVDFVKKYAAKYGFEEFLSDSDAS